MQDELKAKETAEELRSWKNKSENAEQHSHNQKGTFPEENVCVC